MNSSSLIPLLQLSDSAFPTGGFSHSLGLEAYLQHYGIGRTKKDQGAIMVAFSCILHNSGSLSLPFVKAAYLAANQSIPEERILPRPPQKSYTLMELDKLCEACTTNHIAKRASTRQGKSLLEVSCFIHNNLNKNLKALLMKLPHCHYPVVYGAILAGLGLDEDSTLAAFMFGITRSLIATAVRLDVIGAMEGQKLQAILQQSIPDIIESYGLDTKGNLKRGDELQSRRNRLLRALQPEPLQLWQLRLQVQKVTPPLPLARCVVDVEDAKHHSWPCQTQTENQNYGWFSDPKRLPPCHLREWKKHYSFV